MKEVRRRESQQGRFTLVYLAAPGDEDAQVELTYNWDPEVTARVAISGILPMRSTTSTRLATA